MRSKVDTKTFVEALDKVSGLIRKSSIPALNGVLVQFTGDGCTLTSTNIESCLSIRVPAQGDAFSCLLGRPKETARAFRQFDGELVLEQWEKGRGQRREILLSLVCGPRSAVLPAFPPEDFPDQPVWEAEHTFTASAADLYARVKRVAYATAERDPKQSGTCRTSVQFSGNRIYAVDGYRLAWDVNDGLSVPAPFMASPGALVHLKLFDDNQVSVHLGSRWAMATDGVTTLTFRLTEGELFEMDCAVPSEFQTEFYVSPKEFLGELDYLKRALSGKPPCAIRFHGGSLSAFSQGERYATKIGADGCQSVEFGFDLRYMMDALEQFKRESRVKIKCGAPYVPIVIGTDDRSDYAMVLPVRVKSNSAAA